MEKIDLLYKAYFSNRSQTLALEEFEAFVLYSPPLMVIACDNVVDRDELIYVEHFSEFISRTFRDRIPLKALRNELHQKLQEEMHFFLEHTQEWEDSFLDGVMTILQGSPEAKEQVYDLLEMFADSSDGISAVEQQKIDELCQRLGIEQD